MKGNESRLTFIRVVERKIKSIKGVKTHIKGLYKCRCGKEVEIKQGYVKYGNRKTCGCGIGTIKEGGKTHGLRQHPLYKTWSGIKNRCLNEKDPKYKYYGGRGVSICEEWKNDFKCFYDWCIFNGWVNGMEVDKDMKAINLNMIALLYSPEWCSIISKNKNNKYRRGTKFIELNGEVKCISDWCKQFNICRGTYRQRIRKGWTISMALKTPIRDKK